MDRYIKIDDLINLIDKEEEEIKKEYDENKMNKSFKIACLGTLEVLKEKILKEGEQ
jgi:hypothetical protein